MSLLDRIPIPESGMDAFLSTSNIMQDILLKNARRKLPFAGNIPSGVAGQVVGLEMLKSLYGENSPQYNQAKSMNDLNQESARSRINYQNILSESAPKRFSTSFAKTQQELNDIKKGNYPGTNNEIENEQEKDLLENQYRLNLIKSTSDPKTRERLIYSTNIDKTIDQLNPNDLTSYSGLKGTAELIRDSSLSASGQDVPRYTSYTNALNSANLLKKQVRQFYGDSITTTMDERLEKLTNPTSWVKNPKVALENYNNFVKILKSEQKTFEDAISKSSTFQKENKKNIPYGYTPEKDIGSVESENNNYPKIERIKELNGKKYAFFDGSWHLMKG